MTTMDAASCDTEVRRDDYSPGASRAIYGGHISGRRLRGVKINPIYQENESGRYGDAADTQSEGGVPVGEIQIEMYESIPRDRSRRPYGSDPNLMHSQVVPDASYTTTGSDAESSSSSGCYYYSGQESDYGQADRDEQLQFSKYCLPPDTVKSTGGADTNEEDAAEPETTSEKKSWSQKVRVYKRQLMRQHRIDATADDPDVIEITIPHDNSPSTSGYSSPSGSSSSFSISPNTPGSLPKKSKIQTRNKRTRQLSAVQEQNSVSEDEAMADVSKESSDLDYHSAPDLDSDGTDSNDKINANTTVTVMNVQESVSAIISDEGYHFVSFSGGKDGKDELFSGQIDGEKLPFSPITRSDYIINPSTPHGSPVNGIVSIPRSKAMYSLDKIAMLPSFKDIDLNSSADFINNNFETVPDKMLPSRPYPGDNIRQEPSLDGEDAVVYDEKSLKAFDSFSTNSTYSVKKCHDKLKVPSSCVCGGKPTLSCECGRKTLQKLLRQRKMIKDEVDNDTFIEDISFSEEAKEEESSKRVTNNNKINKCFIEADMITIITESDSETPGNKTDENEKTGEPKPLRPILISCDYQRKQSHKNMTCHVTFSEDTIFNENNHVKYIKECYNPADTALINTDFLAEDDDGGFDNPVFDDEEDLDDSGQAGDVENDDESDDDGEIEDVQTEHGVGKRWNRKRKSDCKHPKARNKIVSNGSLLLKVSDLNAPSYMQKYLSNGNGCDIVRSPIHSNPNRAAPVSIEAIGGTVVDPDFDTIGEAAEEDFEYYRRRRQKRYGDGDVEAWIKKIDRPKKIKICVIVVTVLILVIAAIALAIHFGAPSVGEGGTSGVLPEHENSLSSFVPGLF